MSSYISSLATTRLATTRKFVNIKTGECVKLIRIAADIHGYPQIVYRPLVKRKITIQDENKSFKLKPTAFCVDSTYFLKHYTPKK